MNLPGSLDMLVSMWRFYRNLLPCVIQYKIIAITPAIGLHALVDGAAEFVHVLGIDCLPAVRPGNNILNNLLCMLQVVGGVGSQSGLPCGLSR